MHKLTFLLVLVFLACQRPVESPDPALANLELRCKTHDVSSCRELVRQYKHTNPDRAYALQAFADQLDAPPEPADIVLEEEPPVTESEPEPEPEPEPANEEPEPANEEAAEQFVQEYQQFVEDVVENRQALIEGGKPAVLKTLLAPRSAQFVSGEISAICPNLVVVSYHVDSQNAFGATLRSFQCAVINVAKGTVMPDPKCNWSSPAGFTFGLLMSKKDDNWARFFKACNLLQKVCNAHGF